MILNYKEIIDKVGNNYNLTKLIKEEKLFKVEKGIYSDNKDINYWQVIFKKYPNAVIADKSAYFYYGLIQNQPEIYYVATKRNHTRIKDKKIKQKFYKNLDLRDSVVNFQVVTLEDTNVKILSREMLLVELFRNKNKISNETFNQILNGFKTNINDIELDVVKIIMYNYYDYETVERHFKIIEQLILN